MLPWITDYSNSLINQTCSRLIEQHKHGMARVGINLVSKVSASLDIGPDNETFWV